MRLREGILPAVTRQTFFATCAPGVEPILYAEAKDLKLAKLEQQVGGVFFEGTPRDAWRANLWLRTAVRVLQRVARFEAPDEDQLYAGIQSIDWSPWLPPDGRLWIDAQTRESGVDHSRYAAQRVKDAIVDQLRRPDGSRPTIEREDYDLRVHVHLYRNRATVSIDTSGESLHKRGWRRAQGKAPLAETLAAALVLGSGWDGRAPIIDPFCGSGTILVEAGLIAAGIAPGSFRDHFAFESFPHHDAAAWAREKEDAAKAVRVPPKLALLGSDHYLERIEQTRENLDAAGLAELGQLEQRDARTLAPKPGWNGWIISNVPYGERVGGPGAVRLVGEFAARLRENARGYHVSLLTGGPEQAQALRFADSRQTRLVNGGLECTVVHAAL